MLWRHCIKYSVAIWVLGIGSLPLTAQVVGTLTCTASAGVAPVVRAEGLAELVGDLVMICTGGTPTPVGSPVPQVNVTVALNTNITSRILAGSLTEALAMIDEPGTPGSSPQLLCGTPGTIESPTGTCNGITGTGTGRGVYSGTGVRANVFQGQLSASTQVVWTGIPLDPPGSASRIIRFTNIRANASIIGSGSAAPGIIAAAISISGITSVSLSNSVNNVAFVQTGIAFAVRTAANTLT